MMNSMRSHLGRTCAHSPRTNQKLRDLRTFVRLGVWPKGAVVLLEVACHLGDVGLEDVHVEKQCRSRQIIPHQLPFDVVACDDFFDLSPGVSSLWPLFLLPA
jgi:hypothetical protein